MDEWYLIRSDDHEMAKAMVLMVEIMDAVMDMASVMVTCRISVQDPMKNLAPDAHLVFTWCSPDIFLTTRLSPDHPLTLT